MIHVRARIYTASSILYYIILVASFAERERERGNNAPRAIMHIPTHTTASADIYAYREIRELSSRAQCI